MCFSEIFTKIEKFFAKQIIIFEMISSLPFSRRGIFVETLAEIPLGRLASVSLAHPTGSYAPSALCLPPGRFLVGGGPGGNSLSFFLPVRNFQHFFTVIDSGILGLNVKQLND